MKVKATNHYTGEIIELPANSPAEIVNVWRAAQELEKQAKVLKDQAKKIVPGIINANGTSEPIGGYQFRAYTTQRMNYDKSVMREVLDADTFDLLLIPDKPAIDNYLRENLEKLPNDVGTRLRKEMVPVGNPYQTIKLEKL